MNPMFASRLAVVLLVSLSVVGLSFPGAADAKFKPAKRTHAPDLKPPIHRAGEGVEGWALVCVTVKVDGTVAHARVVDVGPSGEFAEAGLEAAQGWKFEPATVDGEPSEQSNVCDLQLFTMAIPADAKTTKKLADAEALLDDDKPDEAARILRDLVETGPLTLAQGAELQLLEYRIRATKDDQAGAVAALERATIGGARYLPEEDRLPALGAKFTGLVGERRYREALALFATFEGIEGGARPMVVHGKTAADIRELEKSDKSFTVPAKLEPALAATGGLWGHRPLRRELGVQKLEGKLDAFVIECDLRTMRLDYQEDVSWRIPDSWGDCAIYAEGAPDATFDLIEYGPQ